MKANYNSSHKILNSKLIKTYTDLIVHLRKAFPNLPQFISIEYLDLDQELIHVANQNDFELMLEQNSKIKLIIKSSEEASNASISQISSHISKNPRVPKTEFKMQKSNNKQCHSSAVRLKEFEQMDVSIFENAVCRECNQEIKESRYKCFTCCKVDLCKHCFEKQLHASNHKVGKITDKDFAKRINYGRSINSMFEEKSNEGEMLCLDDVEKGQDNFKKVIWGASDSLIGEVLDEMLLQ